MPTKAKIVLVVGTILYTYVCLVLVDIACKPVLTFCRMYEPFSPW